VTVICIHQTIRRQTDACWWRARAFNAARVRADTVLYQCDALSTINTALPSYLLRPTYSDCWWCVQRRYPSPNGKLFIVSRLSRHDLFAVFAIRHSICWRDDFRSCCCHIRRRLLRVYLPSDFVSMELSGARDDYGDSMYDFRCWRAFWYPNVTNRVFSRDPPVIVTDAWPSTLFCWWWHPYCSTAAAMLASPGLFIQYRYSRQRRLLTYDQVPRPSCCSTIGVVTRVYCYPLCSWRDWRPLTWRHILPATDAHSTAAMFDSPRVWYRCVHRLFAPSRCAWRLLTFPTRLTERILFWHLIQAVPLRLFNACYSSWFIDCLMFCRWPHYPVILPSPADDAWRWCLTPCPTVGLLPGSLPFCSRLFWYLKPIFFPITPFAAYWCHALSPVILPLVIIAMPLFWRHCATSFLPW